MLRKITIGCAVVVAMLAAPVMSAHSMMGGMGGHGFGGMHGSGGMHSFGGAHNFGMASRWGGVHTFNHSWMPRHHFALFATAVGVGSCWRWVPTRWGWHRVWVCD